MRRLLLVLAFGAAALAQPTPTNPVRFVTTNPSGACAANSPLRYNTTNGALSGCNAGTWAVIGGGSPGGTTGQIQFNAGSTTFGGFTLSGDCTANTSTGVITCTKINGTTPGGSCTNQVVTSISSSGVPTCGSVSNAMLTNPATTVNGQTCTLGSSCTVSLSLDPSNVITGPTFTFGNATYNSGIYFNRNATPSTAVTGTLPTAAANSQFCVSNSNNGSAADTGALTVQTSASGQYIIYSDGTLTASGGYIVTSGAAADLVCVVGVDSTHWQLVTCSNQDCVKH